MKVAHYMIKIMGLSPASNEFSLFLWDLSLQVCLKLQYGCGKRGGKKGVAVCIHLPERS